MSDAIAAPAEEPATPAKKRLTQTEWAEIEVHWEYGTMRTMEICTKYGITPSAITQHFAKLAAAGRVIHKGGKRNIVAAQAAALAGAASGIKEVSAFEAKRKERVEQTKETIYRASTSNAILFGRIQKQIADGTIVPAAATADLKALRIAESFIKLSRENRYAVLDIENDIDERDLPTLVFEDLTKEEITRIQDGDDEEIDTDDLIPDADDEGDDDIVVQTGPEI